ncbi:hypothetical protein DXG03_005805 [Asterophora parasitica]|uniref:LysM domain-containing protein n=1 Tax=Asterophora parasitica TaxID=117018 RepID=A0A9P7GA07_9AGAR|nr:hypothetical protein DXG03_005805 [Asterophora parasitica]
MRDEDTFVIVGDDEEEEDLFVEHWDRSSQGQDQSATATQGVLQGDTTIVVDDFTMDEEGESVPSREETEFSVRKYHITKSDTLQGIVLRFGLDGHELCRLNNLPPSTLRTTPHLLHTRRYIILPMTGRNVGVPLVKETAEQARKREVIRGKERAEKRLQLLTKEVDWRVAKAYVALADDPWEEEKEKEEWERKRKESSEDRCMRAGPSNLEERAIGKYLDDDEWEERQLKEGSKVGSDSMGMGIQSEKDGHSDGRWWRRRN